MITTLIAVPLVGSLAFGTMALLGSNPWAMVFALPLALGGCWVLA